MRPDDLLLSAYLDGEVPEQFRTAIAASIESDPVSRTRFEQLQRLCTRLRSEKIPEIEVRMTRSLESIQRKVSAYPRTSSGLRWRQIGVPVPAFAAAALVIVALAVVLVLNLLPRAPTSAPDYLAQGQDVDVTIRVDNADMERVLQWLADKEMLGEISIQLPEQQFRIVGEPVLLKPTNSLLARDLQGVHQVPGLEDSVE